MVTSDEAYRPLLEDMELALRSELGARTLYPLLRRWARDPELRRVLDRLAEDQGELVSRLRALMKGLGGAPPRRSYRRLTASWVIAIATPVLGLRFALRLCHDAETAVARWYGTYRSFFASRGEAARALECEQLSQIKLRHAAWLETWVQNAPFRRLGR